MFKVRIGAEKELVAISATVSKNIGYETAEVKTHDLSGYLGYSIEITDTGLNEDEERVIFAGTVKAADFICMPEEPTVVALKCSTV